jgi:hypothetical protein
MTAARKLNALLAIQAMQNQLQLHVGQTMHGGTERREEGGEEVRQEESAT